MAVSELRSAAAVPLGEQHRSTPPVDLLVAAVLLVCAVAATLRAAPTALLAPLWLAAAASVASRVAAGRRAGGLDRWLLATGGTLVALMLLGLFLDLTGIGLRPATWALGLGVLGLVGLVTGGRGAPTPGSASRLPSGALRAAPWGLAAAVVTAVALHSSVLATDRAEVAPAQLTLGRVDGPKVEVQVSADRPVGPLELRTTAADGNSVSYPLISVRHGNPVTTTVMLPTKGRFTVSLYYPNQSEPLRSLTLDR